MLCYKCKMKMSSVDDFSTTSESYNLYKCNKCKSTVLSTYDNFKKEVVRVEWVRYSKEQNK